MRLAGFLLLGAIAIATAACPGRGRRDETVDPDALAADKPARTTMPDTLAIVGPGVRLDLTLPVHLERMGDGPTAPVRIVNRAKGRVAMLFAPGDEAPPREPTVRPIGDGAWVELDADVDLATIGQAESAPPADAWSLGFGDAVMGWPRDLVVDGFVGDVPRLELRRFADPRDVMIIVRGPLRDADVPALPELVGPGQRERGRDAKAVAPWIELVYEHDGTTWHQRHHRVVAPRDRVVLVTAQSTADLAKRVIADADTVARSISFSSKAR